MSDASLPRAILPRRRRRLITASASSRFLVPFWLLASVIVIVAAWQPFSRLSWMAPSAAWFATAVAPFFLIAAYLYKRRSFRAAEFSLFVGANLLYAFTTIRLSCLGLTLHRPFIDGSLRYADRLVGFDWDAWARFVESHRAFYLMHVTLYPSITYQCFLFIGIFSAVRPRSRNFELLFLSLVGVLISIAIFTAFPTIGPARWLGVQHVEVITRIRSGSATALPYIGLISFPSYHTFLAIIYIYCCRGIRFLFPAVASANGLMLLTIPYGGDHNLVDMVGGAIIAAACIAMCRRLYRDQDSLRPVGLET